MIGELNEVEPTPSTAPRPLPATVPVMIAAIRDPQQVDAVRVAAMVGILRHLKLNGISSPEARGPVRDAALEIARAAQPPPGRPPAGHAWMRAQAAEILGELGDAGPGGSIAAALAAIVADSQSSTNNTACFGARCAAARALGKLSYQAGAGVNPPQIATALGQLALDACAAEDGQAFSLRRLKDRVSAATAGLIGADDQHKGIEPLMTDSASQQLLGELRPTLQAVLDTLDDKKLSSDEVIEKLTEPRTKLQKLFKKGT